MKVIIDNGHGSDTPGKRSPDGRLYEWKWTRILANRIKESLTSHGVDSAILVPEDIDISLADRCRRANAIVTTSRNADATGKCILISLHNNAAGMGDKWHVASGFAAFVSRNASADSMRLAHLLTRQAIAADILGNRHTPTAGFHIANFAICRDTICPAALTENLFMDNLADIDFLLSERGLALITHVHTNAILKYFNINL
ncbi:MAG: N-acetylmuramoyl-L-alanine amidase [Muribaculaceae bacterium]|nr:N-acetylmuramoyl-L-alanine amidase [Muribaculaceae bacterium]